LTSGDTLRQSVVANGEALPQGLPIGSQNGSEQGGFQTRSYKWSVRIMGTEKKYCSICAWRESCQKRYSIATDAAGSVRCVDYSRDLSIKEKDIDAAEKAYRES